MAPPTTFIPSLPLHTKTPVVRKGRKCIPGASDATVRRLQGCGPEELTRTQSVEDSNDYPTPYYLNAPGRCPGRRLRARLGRPETGVHPRSWRADSVRSPSPDRKVPG